MLSDFFAWWLQHLLELLPWRRAAKAVDEADALLIVPIADAMGDYRTLELRNRKQHQTSVLGVFSADAKGISALRPIRRLHATQPLRLQLPEPMLLEKLLRLPIGAESSLDHVIQNEMDRETPFASDEVLWSYAVETRNRAVGWIKVRLSILPRRGIEAIIALLPGDFGLKAIEARTANGALRLLPLDPVKYNVAVDWRLRAAIILCVVLFFANLLVPFLQQSVALARVDYKIAAIRPTAEAARSLRDQIAGNSSGFQTVSAARDHAGDLMQVLAEATKTLPDHTHLVEFALTDGKLSLAGRSANPGTIIPEFSKNPLFHAPSFTSPVSRIEGTPFSLFSIGAGVGTGP